MPISQVGCYAGIHESFRYHFCTAYISFRVPGRTLLHPLSLTFPAGKATGLIGHNGSGKSTLLKTLGRHQPPSEGEILLDAQPLKAGAARAFARKWLICRSSFLRQKG